MKILSIVLAVVVSCNLTGLELFHCIEENQQNSFSWRLAMKVEKICCPACGAELENSIEGKKVAFCRHCGSQLAIDNGERTFTKNINIHKRFTDDAGLKKEQRLDRENERQHKESMAIIIVLALLFIICIGSLNFMSITDKKEEESAIEAGMIQVKQSSADMEGKKYQEVEAQLRSAGFTNIKTLDLNDANIFDILSNKEYTVESVSINGDPKFYSSDYFPQSSEVIITYH